MLATSVLFGLYHPHFWSAFTASVILVCVMRRTGSIRAPIMVHAIYNFMLWWPLLGRHVFPSGPGMTDLSTWYFHGACLIAVAVALPIYAWMSRDLTNAAPTLILEPNAPLPQ
jgi:membrane protease YdiL (CAAX protease family)